MHMRECTGTAINPDHRTNTVTRTTRTRADPRADVQVVDAESIRAGEPSTIEAVYFMATSSDEERDYAKAVHASLLLKRGLVEGAPGTPPLLLVDLVGGGSVPFALPTKAWLD